MSFKKGDRVVLTSNMNNVYKKGDTGVVVRRQGAVSTGIRFDHNNVEAYPCNHRIKLIEAPSELRVDTLSYPVEFKGKNFKIGCQTVSHSDALKIADFIKSQEVAPKLSFRKGDILVESSGLRYLVTQPTPDTLSLIGLACGHRWTNPITVKNIVRITEEEIKLLVGSGTFTKESK